MTWPNVRHGQTCVLIAVLCLGLHSAAFGQARPLDPRDAELPKIRFPDEFAMVFSNGYVNDFMPRDPARFEKTLVNMKRVGINTIHCKYTDWRRELCEKHGIMMMIDLAVPEHDLKQARCTPAEARDLTNLDGSAEGFAAVKKEFDAAVARIKEIDKALAVKKGDPPLADEVVAPLRAEREKVEAKRLELDKEKSILIASNVKYLCGKCRDSKGVWGYGLYYDNGTNGSYLNHAVEKLRLWDPTHVTFVGSYRHNGLETVTINPGCYGWYDFHWDRGHQWHFLDMMVVHDICKRRGAIMGNYAGYAGLTKDLFTVNQCIAAGGKMTMWFIGGPIGRDDSSEWVDGTELEQVAAEFRHLYRELMLIGSPSVFYSTPVSKTPDDKPIDPAALPRWFKAFPPDCWVQPETGEVMAGLFKYADGTDATFVASHNALVPQEVRLKLIRPEVFTVSIFDRQEGGWKPLPVVNGTVTFPLAAGGGELLKLGK